MKKCFVISPIGFPGSDIREHADDVFDFIVKPAAEKAGYLPIRADHEARPGTITEHMYDHILGDDLLIAILTGHNPNVFYEVAVAEAAARPLILLIEAGQSLPFDISSRRVISYDLKIRSFHQGSHQEALYRSILELEADKTDAKVPFRPSLRPLGGGEGLWRLVTRSRDVTREEQLEVMHAARSFVWYQGVALFSFVKLTGFEAAVRAALSRGIEIRVLLMSPQNPALEHMIRRYAPNYIDSIRGEIDAASPFWTSFADVGPLTVRYQTEGAMFGLLQQSDLKAIYTQYSYVRSTSESPTLLTAAGTPFYETVRSDFQWQWDRAATQATPTTAKATSATRPSRKRVKASDGEAITPR